MQKKTSAFVRVLTAATTVLTVIATALRVVLMQNYSAENGFYADSSLRSVFRILLIAATAIFFVVRYIYIKEGNLPKSLPANKALRIVSAGVGCVLGGFALFTFAKAVLPAYTVSGVDLALTVLALAAMLYYFTVDKKGDFRALLCSASALLLLVMIFGLYFDPTFGYVNHSGILAFSTAIFVMLAFSAEANFALGMPAYRRYFAYAPPAAILSLALSLPDLIYTITVGGAVLTIVYYDILFLAFGIYHLTRLVVLSLEPVKE